MMAQEQSQNTWEDIKDFFGEKYDWLMEKLQGVKPTNVLIEEGSTAEQQQQYMDRYLRSMPEGIQMAAAMDGMGMDLTKTQEDGSYSVSGDAVAYAEGVSLGIMDKDGNVQLNKAMEYLNTDYGEYTDEMKEKLGYVLDANRVAASCAYTADGTPALETEEGQKLGSFLKEVDSNTDIMAFQDMTKMQQMVEGKGLVTDAMDNMDTISSMNVNLDAKTMLQFGEYQKMRELAEKGELTEEAVNEHNERINEISNMSDKEVEELISGNARTDEVQSDSSNRNDSDKGDRNNDRNNDGSDYSDRNNSDKDYSDRNNDGSDYSDRNNSDKDFSDRNNGGSGYSDRNNSDKDFSDRNNGGKDYSDRNNGGKDYSDRNNGGKDYSDRNNSGADYSQRNNEAAKMAFEAGAVAGMTGTTMEMTSDKDSVVDTMEIRSEDSMMPEESTQGEKESDTSLGDYRGDERRLENPDTPDIDITLQLDADAIQYMHENGISLTDLVKGQLDAREQQENPFGDIYHQADDGLGMDGFDKDALPFEENTDQYLQRKQEQRESSVDRGAQAEEKFGDIVKGAEKGDMTFDTGMKL